jgi:cell division protein FtsW
MKSIIADRKKITNPKKKEIPRLDVPFLMIAMTLLTLGTIIVFSASYPYAASHYGDGHYYIKRQAVFLFIGLASMAFVSRVNTRIFKKDMF